MTGITKKCGELWKAKDEKEKDVEDEIASNTRVVFFVIPHPLFCVCSLGSVLR